MMLLQLIKQISPGTNATTFQSLYMALAIVIMDGNGLINKARYDYLPKETNVKLWQ